jgi:hypothetical protein
LAAPREHDRRGPMRWRATEDSGGKPRTRPCVSQVKTLKEAGKSRRGASCVCKVTRRGVEPKTGKPPNGMPGAPEPEGREVDDPRLWRTLEPQEGHGCTGKAR